MTEQNEVLTVDDDCCLVQLLKEFELETVFDYLKAAQVTYSSLQYMQQDDLKEAIPPLGLRMEFREKLFKWKKQQFGIDDDTISVQSKVDNWLIEKDNFEGKQVLNKSLISIIKETQSGRSILKYKNKNLTTDHMSSLIKIIVEEAVSKDIQIRIQDFPLLVKEIVWVFPSEQNVQDYYFIARGKKGNPSGKLYSKYKNFRSKLAKYGTSSSQEENMDIDNTTENLFTQAAEIDEAIAEAFKTCLKRDSADWANVCEKWQQTFKIRRRELLELKSVDFFKSWSKLSHAKAADLIQIDFDLLYPEKRLMLFSKWELFKTKILNFYEHNITNEVCKQQLCKAKETKNIDSQDYLITILLNSIFPSSARLKNNDAKKQRKLP